MMAEDSRVTELTEASVANGLANQIADVCEIVVNAGEYKFEYITGIGDIKVFELVCRSQKALLGNAQITISLLSGNLDNRSCKNRWFHSTQVQVGGDGMITQLNVLS